MKTVVQPPSRTSFSELSQSKSIATPEQALHLFEARRSWAFSIGLAVATAVGLVLLWLIGGDPLAIKIHAAGLIATCAVSSWYALSTRNVDNYRPWKLLVLTYVSIVTNATGYYYWGVFSAYAMLVTFSGYAFSSGSGKTTATRASIGLSVLGHAGLGIAQLLGWIDERSLVVAPAIPLTWQVTILVVLNLILVGVIYAGYDAYSTLASVFDAHGTAQRAVALKEVQLAEANAEAREARRPGEGRHSGQTVGRFVLGDVLGRGAMGEVYAATDDRGNRCAVKVLAVHLLGNEDAIQRFHREARAISAIESPNIVKLIEVAPPGTPLPFIAMERLEGRDLGAILKEQPIHELGDVVSIVRAVAAGLDAAHAAGVIHRDLKPANVFAATGGDRVAWKILDFGVSKLLAADATMTAGQLVGTPGYMAPEQARGEEIDHRADIYSLGVVAYRLLTGRPAVVPADVPAMLHDVVYRMPPPPSQLAQVPPPVEAVLSIALAKSPGDRFDSAGELAAALAEAAAGFTSPVIAERSAAVLRKLPWGPWQHRASSRAKTAALGGR